jgi:hypothetical protein
LRLPFFAAAFRLTLYAIATACLTGFPAFTSAPTFFRNADLLDDFTRGINFIFGLGESGVVQFLALHNDL